MIFVKKDLNIPNSKYVNLEGQEFVNGLLTLPKDKKKYWKRNIDQIDYKTLFNFFISNEDDKK